MSQPISLLTLNEIIRDTLDMHLEPQYWVIAEIAQLTHASQGHGYMDLVEKSGNKIAAKVRANCWAFTFRSVAGKFSQVTGQQLKSGMKVLALVSVTYHELYGLSLNIKDIDPNFTLGERARKKQEVLDQLNREGLLQLNKTLNLPIVPQRIAIISSATAAGYGDFVNQIENNRFGYKVHHELYQATLQGNEAVPTLNRAFEKIQSDHERFQFDAVLLIRGGGAQLDLDCFDEFDLAATIARCSIPVITGIGHERDETVADLVAHTRMKTPTAAAEFILSGFQEFEANLIQSLKQLERKANVAIQQENQQLHALKSRLEVSAKTLLHQHKQSLLFKENRLLSHSRHKISMERIKLDAISKSIRASSHNNLQKASVRLLQLEKEIKNLNPASFFERGYTRTEVDGVPIHKAKLEEGKEIDTYTLDKKITSTIKKIKNHGG